MTAISQPAVRVDMSSATIAARKRITVLRRNRIALILAKIRRLLNPNEMRATDNFETWSAFAVLFAVVPEEPWHAQDIHQRLTAILAKNMAADGYLPITYARVLDLTSSLAFVADQRNPPEGWPTVQQLGED